MVSLPIMLVSLGIPRTHSVVCELTEVCGWVLLGVCFGLPRRCLVNLARESEGLSKISLISSWLGRVKDVSWKSLVLALCAIHRKHLAVKIAAKYGMNNNLILYIQYSFFLSCKVWTMQK